MFGLITAAWSNWQAFRAGPVSPAVTALNLTTVPGQTFAAANLFAASDPDGGMLTTYGLWDSITNGHFAVNGVTLAANTEIDVTGAQLAQTTYVSGNGTDQLYVSANNGSTWSNWGFTATGSTPAIINTGATVELGSAYPSQVTFFGPTGTLKLAGRLMRRGRRSGGQSNRFTGPLRHDK